MRDFVGGGFAGKGVFSVGVETPESVVEAVLLVVLVGVSIHALKKSKQQKKNVFLIFKYLIFTTPRGHDFLNIFSSSSGICRRREYRLGKDVLGLEYKEFGIKDG